MKRKGHCALHSASSSSSTDRVSLVDTGEAVITAPKKTSKQRLSAVDLIDTMRTTSDPANSNVGSDIERLKTELVDTKRQCQEL